MKSIDGGSSWTVQDSSVSGPVDLLLHNRRVHGGRRTRNRQRRPTVRLGTHRLHLQEQLSERACPVPNAITCVAVGMVNRNASHHRYARWRTLGASLDQPLRRRHLSSVSCFDAIDLRGCRNCNGGGATTLSTSTEVVHLDPFRHRFPIGQQLNCVAVARTRPLASPWERISTRPRTSSTRRTTAPPGRSRAHHPMPSISRASPAQHAEDCIAVGNSGNNGAGSTIMGTTTGGLSWTAQRPPAGTSTLNSVSCPSTADCFAAGVDSVLTSRNAGYAWTHRTDSCRQ